MRDGYLRRRFRIIDNRWGDRLLTALTLLLAFIAFVIVPLHASGLFLWQGYGFAIVLLVASCVLGVSRSPFATLGLIIGAGFIAVAVTLRLKGRSPLDLYFDAAGITIIGLALAAVVSHAVFAPGRITYHRVNGAILLYLIIGLIFVPLYAIIGLDAPKAFVGLRVDDHPAFLSNLVYFSFVTMTTIGYGDITPAHPLARSLCNVEGIIGQLYPATLLARLVTLELEDRRGARGVSSDGAP